MSASSHLSQSGVSSRFVRWPWQGLSFSDGRCGPWRAVCPCLHRSLPPDWEPAGPLHGFLFRSISDSGFCLQLEGDRGYFYIYFKSVVGICCSRGYISKGDHVLSSWLVPTPDLKKFFSKLCAAILTFADHNSTALCPFNLCSHLSLQSENWMQYSFSESHHDPPAERLIQGMWLERDIWVVFPSHKAWTSVTRFK